MDRRQFAAASAAAVLTIVVGCTPDDAETRQADLDEPRLLRALGPEGVRKIGADYRAANPGEASAPALRAAINASRRAPGFGPWTRRALDEQVEADFGAGRNIVIVNGWVLSTTEARQCALYSLLHA
jgi:hypothetical protein